VDRIERLYTDIQNRLSAHWVARRVRFFSATARGLRESPGAGSVGGRHLVDGRRQAFGPLPCPTRRTTSLTRRGTLWPGPVKRVAPASLAALAARAAFSDHAGFP
jgi:hypothetical protein